MNSGMSLTELAARLEHQREASRDFVGPQGKFKVEHYEDEAGSVLHQNGLALLGVSNEPLTIRPHAHSQLADELGIPKRYYDRMLAEHPDLLAQNVNTWLQDNPGVKRMVRTLDGQVRAVLSSSYRPLDNAALASAALPVLIERGAQVTSTAITETRMYVKAILPALSDEIPSGVNLGVGHDRIDVVQAGIVISNSEVGAGAVRIEPSIFRIVCTNMLTVETKLRRHHVGRDQGINVDFGFEELLQDETKRVRDAAFWKTVRDVVASAFNETVFRGHVEKIRRAAVEVIDPKADLAQVVEVTTQRLALPAGLNTSILNHLAQGGDLSRWGLINAYTRVANDQEDYETSTLLERAGGAILELPKREWDQIARAA